MNVQADTVRQICDDLGLRDWDPLRAAAFDFSQRPSEEQIIRLWVSNQIAARERAHLGDDIRALKRAAVIGPSGIVAAAISVIYVLQGGPLPPLIG